MKRAYFLSGLGADRRVFAYLDLSFCEPVFIDWIPPLKNESLTGYALRLRATIPEKDPVVVGLSLGGMLASEMAKADKGVKAIIISSNKSSNEFPHYLRVFKHVPVYKWMPGMLMKNMQRLYTYAFGVTDPAQKRLLYEVIADADMKFVKWAIEAILRWDNASTSDNITHIHGTADRLLKLRFVQADHVIEGGSHTMTLDKHREVSEILRVRMMEGR